MDLKLPVQATVDRRILLDVYLLSRNIVKDGKIIQIFKNPVDGPFGTMPGEPGQFSLAVDPRLRGCEMFSGHGCLRGTRYF